MSPAVSGTTLKNWSKNMIKEGTVAPTFTAKNADGETVRLKDLRGQKVVLYFYPKDDTPGCTKEACSFRDAFADFKKRGIEVLGVSVDSEASHKKFAAKYKLPFTLLADPNHAIADAYGVYGEKKFMGRTYLGVKRITFLIDEKGKIKKVFEKVKPWRALKELGMSPLRRGMLNVSSRIGNSAASFMKYSLLLSTIWVLISRVQRSRFAIASPISSLPSRVS